MRLLGLVFIYLWALSSHSMTFTINNQSSALLTTGADGAVRTAMFSMAQSMQDQINNSILIPESSFQTTLTAFSNATSANANGLGVVYSGGIQKLVIGAGIGAGYSGSASSIANLGSIRSNNLPDVGGGAQASILVGGNASALGWKIGNLDSKRLNVFANAMYLYNPNLYGIGLKAWNLGVHAQYLLHAPSQGSVVMSWGGDRSHDRAQLFEF